MVESDDGIRRRVARRRVSDGVGADPGLRLSTGRGETGGTARRHHLALGACRHRRTETHPGTVRFLRHHVGCRRQRNDAKRNDTRHDGISRASGSVGTVQARASAHRRGRDHPLGFATDVDATNSSGGHTDCRHCDCEGAACRTALRLGELRRNRLREPRRLRHHPRPRTRTSRSEEPGRTTASAPTWPEWRSI